jgi:iron complex outermembrane receptor protein
VQRSHAIFGQAEFALTDQFTLIAGARQTWDEVRLKNRFFVDPANGVRFAPAFSPVVDTEGAREVDTSNFSYRLGLQFEPSDRLTFFATYSRGYKGPAINNTAALGAAPPIVNSEIPTNIEVGFKAASGDGRLRADLSLFDTRVKDFQAQTTVQVNGLTQFVFANASELHFRGVQLNLYGNPAEGLNFNAGVLYNEATYGDFIVQCNAPFLEGCTVAPGGASVINAQGRQLAGAPKWKLTLGGSFEQPLSERLIGFVDANVAYRSRINSSPTPDPNLVIPGYALVDGRIGLRSEDERWRVSIFAKNLFDKQAAGLIFRDPLSPTGNYMQSFVSNAFRTIGATFEFRY